MGDEFFTKIAGKVVIDFGCGEGAEAVEMAGGGAKQVIGIDIREDLLKAARQRAVSTGVQNSCHFVSSTKELADIVVSSTKELADIVVSLDSFEHFADPAGILRIINTLLHPTGEVLVSFGPTWYHPSGGHLFSVFSMGSSNIQREGSYPLAVHFSPIRGTLFHGPRFGKPRNEKGVLLFFSQLSLGPLQCSLNFNSRTGS